MLPSAKKDCIPTTQNIGVEFSCRCEARYVGRTAQRLAERIKPNVPMIIRKKSNTVSEQPPRLCIKNPECAKTYTDDNFRIIEQDKIIRKKSNTVREQPPRLCIKNPECAKTYTDDNFRIIEQARSSFHLSVLESVYMINPVLCNQKDLIFFTWNLQVNNGNWTSWPLLRPIRLILPCVSASGCKRLDTLSVTILRCIL